MRHASAIALTVFGLVFATVFAVPVDLDVSPADETFTFAVAGDIGWNETGAKSQVMLRALQRDKANLSFFLADGDLSYNTTAGTEGAWCNFVKSYVGSQLPFELLAGDQEDNDAVRIGNFAACLPDKLGGKDAYGKEYYFDVPASAPLARFIQISPDLIFPPRTTRTFNGSSGRSTAHGPREFAGSSSRSTSPASASWAHRARPAKTSWMRCSSRKSI